MTIDHIRYDILTQDALRGVVRTVLEDAARNGLPGEHHFYVAFDTRADGVKLSQRMRAQYPVELIDQCKVSTRRRKTSGTRNAPTGKES